jgi:signal transduction histidine kinase
MENGITRAFSRSRLLPVFTALAIVGVVGVADYVTGYEITFSIFYLLAIVLAAWFVGRGFAICVSVLSVGVALAGDLAAGAVYSSRFVPAWNASITFAFYLLFVWLLASLKSFQQQLEEKVRERTSALTGEMIKRETLEKELLAVSEREQQRIGNDLHDSLCQHLTATALAGEVLEEKLSAKSLPEAADASHIIELVEEGIGMARSMARGLFPVQLVAEGLMSALEELARTTTEISKIDCSFESGHQILIYDADTATHLFRIAQETVRNAVKHSGAGHIVISFVEDQEKITLSVKDDGKGLPGSLPDKRGMGLQIMKHRASIIGASFDICSDERGTVVTCVLPLTDRR